jgi:hypothetical protein
MFSADGRRLRLQSVPAPEKVAAVLTPFAGGAAVHAYSAIPQPERTTSATTAKTGHRPRWTDGEDRWRTSLGGAELSK